MEKIEMMREEIKRRIHDVENELQALKELVDSEAFAPNKEDRLTPFQQELYIVLEKAYYATNAEGTEFIKGTVQQWTDKLLELAKREICKGCTVGLDQYWKGREDARKEYEKSYTFHYPTYDPPCPHGGMCTNPFKDCINCPRTGGDIGISTTSETCKKD